MSREALTRRFVHSRPPNCPAVDTVGTAPPTRESPMAQSGWSNQFTAGCVGPLHVQGLDAPVWLIPNPPSVAEGAKARLGAFNDASTATAVQLTHGSRFYFARSDACLARPQHYSAWPLVGATLSFTVDISQAGCGCNVAAYLVSMAQSTQPCICGGNYYGVLFSYSILQK